MNSSFFLSKKVIPLYVIIAILLAVLSFFFIGPLFTAHPDQVVDSAPATNQTNTATYSTTVQIKNDMSMIATDITNYMSNNNGTLPSTHDQFVTLEGEYFAADFKDPRNNKPYTIDAEQAETKSVIEYHIGGICGDDGRTTPGSSKRAFSLQTTLPNGKPYCVGI